VHALGSYWVCLRCVEFVYINHGIVQKVTLFIIHNITALQLWDLRDGVYVSISEIVSIHASFEHHFSADI